MIKVYLGLFMILSAEVWALPGHSHGLVHLDVAIDKGEMIVMVNSPASNFLGFEHRPKNNEQKKQIEDLKKRWSQSGLGLINKKIFSDCDSVTKKLSVVYQGKGHSSIKAEMHLKCKKEIKGRTMDLNWGKDYSGVKQIKLQVLGGRQKERALVIKQKSQTLKL